MQQHGRTDRWMAPPAPPPTPSSGLEAAPQGWARLSTPPRQPMCSPPAYPAPLPPPWYFLAKSTAPMGAGSHFALSSNYCPSPHNDWWARGRGTCVRCTPLRPQQAPSR